MNCCYGLRQFKLLPGVGTDQNRRDLDSQAVQIRHAVALRPFHARHAFAARAVRNRQASALWAVHNRQVLDLSVVQNGQPLVSWAVPNRHALILRAVQNRLLLVSWVVQNRQAWDLQAVQIRQAPVLRAVQDGQALVSHAVQNKPAPLSQVGQNRPALVLQVVQNRPALVSQVVRNRSASASRPVQNRPALVSGVVRNRQALVSQAIQNRQPLISRAVQNRKLLVSRAVQNRQALVLRGVRKRQALVLWWAVQARQALVLGAVQNRKLLVSRAVQNSGGGGGFSMQGERWKEALTILTSLYPAYMILGGALAFFRPATFAWFVGRGPHSYSLALALIMLCAGLSLELQDLSNVLLNCPFAVLYGFASQYIIMPLMGAGVCRLLALSPALSVGLILLSCCPGGTASNVVTYIGRGDVPLSVVMTVLTTFASVFATPLLTQFYAGAYVPVDASALALSTLQVVLIPVLVGAGLQTKYPKIVAKILTISPLVAVLVSSFLASSVFSANVGLIESLTDGASAVSSSSTISTTSKWFILGLVAKAVFLVHFGGFLLGYLAAYLARYSEPQRRAISIEVGMQNSSLGVVLASTHFSSPIVAVPAAVSAVLMNVMGSVLAVVWRYFDRNNMELHE